MNLTGRSYALAVLIIALGILGEWGAVNLASVWRLPAAAIILLLILEGVLIRRHPLQVERHLPESAHLGRRLEVELTFANPHHLPLSLKSMDVYPPNTVEQPEVLEWRLSPMKEQQQAFQVTPNRLGTLEWNTLHLRLRGRFGLAWWSRKIRVPATTNVLPDRLYGNEYCKAATQHQGDMTRRMLGAGHELIGLRDYQPGDPLHFIDWKATARSQRPTVRLYSEEQHLELILVIDAGRTSSMQAGHLTRLGHYTNVAARLAEKAIHHRDQVGLVVFADSVITSLKGLKGHSGLQRLRRVLKQLQTVPRESNPLPAIMQVRRLVHHRSLIVMLTDLDDGDAAAQLVKAMGLLRVKHQPLLAAIMDREVLDLQHRRAKDWLDPFYTLAANEMVQNWQHTRIRLERMGVPVILSSVEQLDDHVLGSYDQLKERKRV